MKTPLIKIGNSQGILIPRSMMQQCAFRNEVELEVCGKTLVVKPADSPRKNWERSFQAMATNRDDKLIESAPCQWDEKEWE